MCLFSYIHYHHQSPCTRAPSLVIHYSYCTAAPVDPVTNETHPCPSAALDPAHSAHQRNNDNDNDDNNINPCERGNCLISPVCSSGACRLQDLNGRWEERVPGYVLLSRGVPELHAG
ncbi:hypothetical protein PT974_04562 [Cladobotryum mycophilum]|uniref:Uncharacterized protein n=1 Tax=Cladobotryum mycophilum TaxID=491253 RepID=A0ABR0SVH6_9HYPO